MFTLESVPARQRPSTSGSLFYVPQATWYGYGIPWKFMGCNGFLCNFRGMIWDFKSPKTLKGHSKTARNLENSCGVQEQHEKKDQAQIKLSRPLGNE